MIRVGLGDKGCITQLNRLGDLGNKLGDLLRFMTSQLCRLKVTRAMLDLLTSSSGDKTRIAYMQLGSDGKIVFANITMHACGMQCFFLCFFNLPIIAKTISP